MSKLNPLVKSTKFDNVTLAGGMGMKAAKQDSISNLRRMVLANLLWEDNFYVDGMSVADEIARLIPFCSPKEVASLVVEARTVQKLRHIPLFICVHMLKHPAHKEYVLDILPDIITRADMLTDMLALYWKLNPAPTGKKRAPIPATLKKALALCFYNFKEYHFAKYDRDGAVKIRDVMFLVHPKPRNTGDAVLFTKIANRTLKAPDTWEVALSTGKDKKQTWERLIDEGKLGGLALLRNLRNMREAYVDKRVIKKGLESIKSSMLLPLNFYSAFSNNPEFSREIEEAMISSYQDLPKLPGKTLFIVDISGSMGMNLSGKSMYNRLQCACIMAMLAANQCEDYELVATAGSDSTRVGEHKHIPYPKKGFDIINQITEDRLGGGGIFTRQCIEWCREKFYGDFDRIIVFSDSQDCDSVNKIPVPFGKYNYICDVSAEKKGINYKGVWTAEISGFSEHFLTYIAAMEGLRNSFSNEE